jgi:hypothetical protein
VHALWDCERISLFAQSFCARATPLALLTQKRVTLNQRPWFQSLCAHQIADDLPVLPRSSIQRRFSCRVYVPAVSPNEPDIRARDREGFVGRVFRSHLACPILAGPWFESSLLHQSLTAPQRFPGSGANPPYWRLPQGQPGLWISRTVLYGRYGRSVSDPKNHFSWETRRPPYGGYSTFTLTSRNKISICI